jgi:hypothetical protein
VSYHAWVKALVALPGAALLALLALAAASMGAERTHDTDLRETLAPGTNVEIQNVFGSIVATPANGEIVTIHAHATSRGGDPAAVVIRATRLSDRLVICPIYPGNQAADCASRTSRRQHPSGHDPDANVRVDFTVAVPSNVALRIDSVNGSVVATGLSDDVWANVVKGDVRLETNRRANARTVDGSIEATIGSTSNDGDLDFETVNGPIRLTLPRGANASISARTLNGQILVDGGLSLSFDDNEFVGRSATAQLGSGGPHINLRAISGSIRLGSS